MAEYNFVVLMFDGNQTLFAIISIVHFDLTSINRVPKRV